MKTAHLEQLILRLENYLECWKQFYSFAGMARAKKFGPDDEGQFLEIKSVITQELELLLASMDCGAISREDVHALITSGPSLRFLSELNDSALKNIENQWHKLFISWQSVLGQLKVRRQQLESKSLVSSWFSRRAG